MKGGFSMNEVFGRKYKDHLVIGVAPTKRGFLSMEEAVRQKEKFMAVIRGVKSDIVTIVDIDDICENGIMYRYEEVAQVAEKFRLAGIDALFTPFCDFGEEQTVATLAARLNVPTLVWGPRDERPNTDESRGRDTQCGMFAATKVMRRYGVRYSYIFNCETDHPMFEQGYTNFLRVVNALKTVHGLRIAKFGSRPLPFISVTGNEGDLMTKFGITTVPVSLTDVKQDADAIEAENGEFYQAYTADIMKRMDCSAMAEDKVRRVAAITMAAKKQMLEKDCTVGAMECWPATSLFGVAVCTTLGELSDDGFPISCENDINGAVTMALLRAISLGEGSVFLADLTIRDPENDNAELLWHCGPFPYSLKDAGCQARLVGGQERFIMKKGALTLCRFDDADNKFYLFAGEGRGIDGPETNGTYVYLETDDWKRWEEKLIFGPYIHHIGGLYGEYFPVLREVARYLEVEFDHVNADGPYSLS